VSENAFSSSGGVRCCLFVLVVHFCKICFRFRVAEVPTVAGRFGWKRAAQWRQTQDH
jgi:hypothetical protein